MRNISSVLLFISAVSVLVGAQTQRLQASLWSDLRSIIKPAYSGDLGGKRKGSNTFGAVEDFTIGQQESLDDAPTGVVVLNLKVSKEPAPRRSQGDRNDASHSGDEGSRRTGRIVRSEAEDSQRSRQGPDNPFPVAAPVRYVYIYSMTIRNEGAKAIKAIAWDHMFIDVGSNEEFRRSVGDYQTVRINETATLNNTSTPPPRVVSAKGLEKDKRSPFLEKVVFRCVLYEDGTLWAHEGPKGQGCEGMQRREMLKKSRIKKG